MAKRIIYQNEEGGVVMVCPAEEFDVMAVALKDVPKGRPFKILEDTDMPSDFTFYSAWEVHESVLDDGHGADYGTGSDKAVVGWNEDWTPALALIVKTGNKEHLVELPQ